MITRFFIYGLAGWCLEVFWTGFGSLLNGNPKLEAHTYLWMFPIYGLAVFLEPLHDKIRYLPFYLRGGLYVLIIFSVEYITGWVLKNTIEICPWDYARSPFAINGFIRLDYAPAWFIAGLLFEKLHDKLIKIL